MASRWGAQQAALGLAGAAFGLLALWLVLGGAGRIESGSALTVLGLLVVVPSLAYIAWHVEPIWIVSAGIVLSCMSGRWDEAGLPTSVAPDRLVIATGMVALLIHNRPRSWATFRVRPVHVVLALTIAYVIASAIAAGTIDERGALFRMVDRVGLVPFVLFAMAPIAFRTAEQRNVLLAALVAFGGYLGLTALFETVGPKALVFPGYILDPGVGAHADRARGPFVEAVANGFAMYASLVAAVIALLTWQGRRARMAAGAVAMLCGLGVIFSLTRSVWIGAIAGSLVVLVATRATRRFALPAIGATTLVVVAALALVPGLYKEASDRFSDDRPVWDRRNLNGAAVNMFEEKPLFGWGWERFEDDNATHFELADYPLTATPDTDLHNAFLANATELGLVGTSLWALGLLLGVGGALAIRGPPELRPWRLGLAAVAICWLVIANFVYPLSYMTLLLWAWAGLVWAGGEWRPARRPATGGDGRASSSNGASSGDALPAVAALQPRGR